MGYSLQPLKKTICKVLSFDHLSPQPLQLREPRPSMNVTFIVQDLGPGFSAAVF